MIKKEYIKPEVTEYEIKLNAQFMTPSLDVHHPTDPDPEDPDPDDPYVDSNW